MGWFVARGRRSAAMRSMSVCLTLISSTLLFNVPSAHAKVAGFADEGTREGLRTLAAKYHQLKATLGNTRYAALLNYRQASWERRFYLVDPERGEIVSSYVVAHGRGSDPQHTGYAQAFSIRDSSHMSSLGFYVTGDTYMSESEGHGLSMRLLGLSKTNRNAESRNIVIHAAEYMEPFFIKAHGKPGRSYGCLVFSNQNRNEIVQKLQGGALIYAIYPETSPTQLTQDDGPAPVMAR
jgi:hypothetical protein